MNLKQSCSIVNGQENKQTNKQKNKQNVQHITFIECIKI